MAPISVSLLNFKSYAVCCCCLLITNLPFAFIKGPAKGLCSVVGKGGAGRAWGVKLL